MKECCFKVDQKHEDNLIIPEEILEKDQKKSHNKPGVKFDVEEEQDYPIHILNRIVGSYDANFKLKRRMSKHINLDILQTKDVAIADDTDGTTDVKEKKTVTFDTNGGLSNCSIINDLGSVGSKKEVSKETPGKILHRGDVELGKLRLATINEIKDQSVQVSPVHGTKKPDNLIYNRNGINGSAYHQKSTKRTKKDQRKKEKVEVKERDSIPLGQYEVDEFEKYAIFSPMKIDDSSISKAKDISVTHAKDDSVPITSIENAMVLNKKSKFKRKRTIQQDFEDKTTNNNTNINITINAPQTQINNNPIEVSMRTVQISKGCRKYGARKIRNNPNFLLKKKNTHIDGDRNTEKMYDRREVKSEIKDNGKKPPLPKTKTLVSSLPKPNLGDASKLQKVNLDDSMESNPFDNSFSSNLNDNSLNNSTFPLK